jgi:hypothetical protein
MEEKNPFFGLGRDRLYKTTKNNSGKMESRKEKKPIYCRF